MSKSVKLINEGFMRRYMKEDLQAALEKDVKNVLKSHGYNVEVEGADSAISAFAEYIDMSRNFGDNMSVEDWLKSTEQNYPEELEFMKVDLNEDTTYKAGPFEFSSNLGNRAFDSVDKAVDKVVDNIGPIAKVASAVVPLLADDASEKKEVFHNSNGEDYIVIERSKTGQNALLNKGNQWIVAWNCPESNEGSWGQGHYFFDEETARKVWEDKYINESLNESFSIVDLESGDSFGGYDNLDHAKSKALQYCSLFHSNCAIVNDNYDVIVGYDRRGKEIEVESCKQTLQEAKWKYQLKSGVDLRKAIDNGDAEAVREALIDCWKEINSLMPDDFTDDELESKVEDLQWLDTDDEEEFEENVDYELSDFYDFCDAFKVWVPLTESINFYGRLKESLTRLDEAEMSDEDKHDSDILWGIYNKTQRRANAALTPEEKEILKKYNLTRSSDYKNIFKKSPNEYVLDGPVVSNQISRSLEKGKYDPKTHRYIHPSTQANINLADKARKMDKRGGYGYDSKLDGYWRDNTDSHREYRDEETGKYITLKNKGLLDKERKYQNSEMGAKVDRMKDALHSRKYHGKQVAKNDAEYDAKRDAIQRDYEKKLADNEKSRKWNGEYHQKGLDSANKTIDKLLRREKEED